MRLFKTALTATGIVALAIAAHAQQGDRNATMPGTVLSAPVNSGSVAMSFKEKSLPQGEMSGILPGLLGLSAKNTFQQTSVNVDQLGISHEAFQQYFDGVPVEEGQILTHTKAGVVQSVNGRVAHLATLNVRPTIDEQEASTNAVNSLNIIKLMKQYPVQMVITSVSENDNEYALSYKVRIDGRAVDGRIVMMDVFIDAKSGKVLNQISLITHTDVVQTANTLYSGARSITVDSTVNGYRLRDNSRKIETYDVGGLDRADTGDYYFLAPRDYYNAGNVWEEQPALMTMTLNTVTNNMLNGLGIQNGNFLTSMVTKGYDANQEMVGWPDMKITQNTSYRLPVISKNVYVFPKDLNYTGGFGKYNRLTDELVDSAFFTLTSIAPGIYPWTDAAGNAGSYEIRMERNPALDAHWGMAQTHDYYMEVFNRNSYDGKGSVLKNYINGIWPSTFNQNNAAALPAPYFGMVYGLGDGDNMSPVVALDVMGHEFTHMVTETNGRGGLRYQAESGALNESFSDIFGTCIEFYTKGEHANWNIGEDVYLKSPGFFRSMSFPKQARNPDTYKGQYWLPTDDLQQDAGGVHYNSGVQNKWFYLLTEGGTGRNDKSDDYTVTGIGIEKAQQIAYHNLMNYLTRSARYYDAYKGSLLAAADLYGDTSSIYQSVKDAWFAVGLTDADSALSVNNIAIADANIKLYPNPATSQVTISSDLTKEVSIQIVNVVGVPVMKQTIGKGINNIDISALVKGIYMIRYDIGGKGYVQKLSVL